MAVNWRGFIERHRGKLLSFAVVLALYALLGFFLAPWLIKKTAIESVNEMYGAELRIETVAVNPFVLSLRIDGVEMNDPNGDVIARLDVFFANLQLSSIFRRAVTFAELRFDAPEIFIARDSNKRLNLEFLWANTEQQSDTEEASPPRLILQKFSIIDASAHWNDAVPRQPVATTFGPVNIQVFDLSTLPQREGRQDVVITTETTGTFSWSGSLQLNPLRSAGHASIDGSHFPLLSAYVRDAAGFEVVRGNADIELDYDIDTLADGELKINVDNLTLAFNDVLLRTFGVAASDGSNLDRDVLEVPNLRVDGGTLRFPEREVSIRSISVEDSVLNLYRDPAGELNILHHRGQAIEEAPAAETEWSVLLERFDISRVGIGLIDESVNPAADIGIQSLDASITDISNAAGARFPTEIALETRAGGQITLQGQVGALPSSSADLDIELQGISLALLHPYIKSLADVNLDSGALGMSGQLHAGDDEVLSLSADVAISDFLITETDEGSKLGSWDNLALKQLELSLTAESLQISEVQIDRPYGDILIAADGSVNLGRVALGKQTAQPEPEAEAEAADDASSAPPLDVTIGRVVVNDGAADFADLSLPLPFDVQIAELNGTLTTIATGSSEPAQAELEGKVDEFGLVRVTGAITPLQPTLNTDLQVNFENVAMPKFSAYSVPFAGREIASGKLDLFLGYKLTESELLGENKIVLRDFELGDKVDHPGASSLPLGLAVALLKDADGTIDIDLPVRGNVDEPEFRYGSVVGKALVNLVVKIAASPFALLGKLVGAEADELEYIDFQDGRADLTPPEQEKALKLAEALTLRPQLSLQIHGVIDRAADGLALRTARIDRRVDEQIAANSGKERVELLESMFGQEETLKELKIQFTTEGVFDELAYSAELRRLLIDAEELDETDFISLARRRASNIMAAIIEASADIESQISVGEIQAVDKGSDDAIRMKVVLTAGEDDG